MSTSDGTSQTNTQPTEPSGEGTDPRIAALETDLAATRQRLEHSERRAQIQRHLIEAGTIDVDAATLLVEAAIKPGQQVAKAIEDLKRRKPILLRNTPRTTGGGAGSGVMGGAPIRTGADAEHAARQAAESGDRRALLHYMRLRRHST